MGRQALSAAEKQARLLKIFSGENKAKQHFFNKAELEKIGDKEQGITPQSVMEQVDMLVADNLVDKDKLGSAVLFWALPSTDQHKHKRATRSDKLHAALPLATQTHWQTQTPPQPLSSLRRTWRRGCSPGPGLGAAATPGPASAARRHERPPAKGWLR